MFLAFCLLSETETILYRAVVSVWNWGELTHRCTHLHIEDLQVEPYVKDKEIAQTTFKEDTTWLIYKLSDDETQTYLHKSNNSSDLI